MNEPGPSRASREKFPRRSPARYQHTNWSKPRAQSPHPRVPPYRAHKRSYGDDWSPSRNTQCIAPPRKKFRGHADNFSNNNNRQRGYMGFKILEEIAKSESQDILVKINQRKEAFFNLIQSQTIRPDIFVLITDLMAKVSQSSFNELKLSILQEICNSSYLGNFQKYLMDLPYMQVEQKEGNNLYWQNQEVFWSNFVTLSDLLVTLLPMTALQKCRSLIEDSSKLCLEKLAERHEFKLTDECSSRLALLREKLKMCEKEMMEPRRNNKPQTGEDEPPEGFRELSLIPEPKELLHGRPFLRPNIVRGGYRDTEHYLDVQFRLLREDCFGPLRDGIRQYMDKSNQQKLNHIRVYDNVHFIGPYIPKSQQNVGSLVKLDTNNKKWPRRINWAHSKRFLYGSLLLFTKDNCNSFIVATVLEREVELLKQGKIVVSNVNTKDLYNNDRYIMIESEVYFEPYIHVLRALQAPDFPKHIAMEQYIVKVDPQSKPPAYLDAEKQYSIHTQDMEKIQIRVLDNESWPNKEELGFDESQYEAFKLALTQEFAVIQGPPGTGKTYLGVKVARALIDNVSFDRKNCLMLVICYTNHALDQFLEALLPVTKDIVRIGGRSRNEAMDKININNLRKNCNATHLSFSLMRSKKWYLRSASQQLNKTMNCLDSLATGVLTLSSILNVVPESNILIGSHYWCKAADPLKLWLFETSHKYSSQLEPLMWEQQVHRTQKNEHINHVDGDGMNETLFDDGYEDGEVYNINDDFHIATCFSIEATESKIDELITAYNNVMSYKEKQALEEEIHLLKCEIRLFKEMSAYRRSSSDFQLKLGTDPSQLSPINRWLLYFKWANIVAKRLQDTVPTLQNNLKSAANEYEESRMIADLKMLRSAKVVGMTTSGAARLRKLLESLRPPIVIVEEAAEVLEPHIVTSLTKKCQHLILIGDHQQLRPATSNLKLIRQYHTNVSLFERMIMNGVQSRRLGVQHRMRPEIAALISPHIYADLSNHPSVQDFPNVQGICSNLFFFTHNYQEQVVDDSSSRSNPTEGDLALELANYLMQQGYLPEDLVILTTYAGQMFYMRKQREKYIFLSNVKITVVDNYQGEEARIVILSLVRNNPENNVGFLKIENRICVALSRAKEGLYIFGNIETLKSNSDLWKQIAGTLENNEALGTTLKLKCEMHPEKTTLITCPNDFKQVPEGGCGVKCDFERKCGHKCPRLCHGCDKAHVNIKCLENCKRTCELNHTCPLQCCEDCPPCRKLVKKTLPCGHDKQVYCFTDPIDVKCQFILTVTLPDCGHEVKKECYVEINQVLCSVKCMNRVDSCGHRCGRKCHVKDDPDHEKYICRRPCANAKRNCKANLVGDRGEHQCMKKCFESCDDCCVMVTKKRQSCDHTQLLQCQIDIDTVPCGRKCGRRLESCEHLCMKKCHETCGDCIEKVVKVVPDCNHEVRIECSKEATREVCTERCERVLSCGHNCGRRCGRVCDPMLCTQLVQCEQPAPCSHLVQLPCNVYNNVKGEAWSPEKLLKYCKAPCQQPLACEHLCSGTCSDCHQGRLHAPCKQICNQMNICGHQCEEPCNQMCPPCNKRCEIRCSCGLRCNKLCGAPCGVPCPEKCTRGCRHGRCLNRCGELCSRAACEAACERALACGHRCRGLCGEPCPDICNVCRPDDFPVDFLGDAYRDNDRFIKLQDCPHVFEVDEIDALMRSNQEQVKIPTCPLCRTPIVNTYRYKDTINVMFEAEINPIKQRVYGTNVQIKEQTKTLITELKECYKKYQKVREENQCWKKAFNVLGKEIEKQKRVPLPKLEMQSQYLKILILLAECFMKSTIEKSTHLKREFLDLMRILCHILIKSAQKISSQQQKDIGNEIKRLNSIIQLSQIMDGAVYESAKDLPGVAEAVQVAKGSVLTWKKYNEDEGLENMKKLEKVLKLTGIAVKLERELIVKAIGLKAGHWYQCENGHFYCIGECGGAMQTGRCIECNAAIGGSNHRLVANNSHAPEMDRSSFAAWSEANNLANFNIEDIN